MRTAGFTLLEVVVTLAIFVALAALVVPSVSGRLGGESATAVTREIAAGVSMARTDAIRESAARCVVFVTDGSGRATRLVSRAMQERGATAATPRFVGPVLDDPAPVGDEEEVAEVVLLELPRGTRVWRTAPVVGEAEAGGMDAAGGVTANGAGAGMLAPDPETWDQERGESAVTLGVLLPTGAAVAGALVYVTLPGEVTLEVRLEAWTGDAVVTRWMPPARKDEWMAEEPGGAGESDGRAASRGQGRGGTGTGRSAGER